MDIRAAHAGDIPGILAIYNDAVANTTAIWNDTPVDLENRRAWLGEKQRSGYPVLVAAAGDGAVLGYAAFGNWRPWDGYRHTVEHSVYVRQDARGRGVGKALMVQLIHCAETMGKHVMVAGIDAQNEASIRLHTQLGFEEAGLLREVGTKFGRWLDLVFMQLTLRGPGLPSGTA